MQTSEKRGYLFGPRSKRISRAALNYQLYLWQGTLPGQQPRQPPVPWQKGAQQQRAGHRASCSGFCSQGAAAKHCLVVLCSSAFPTCSLLSRFSLHTERRADPLLPASSQGNSDVGAELLCRNGGSGGKSSLGLPFRGVLCHLALVRGQLTVLHLLQKHAELEFVSI